MNMFKAACIQMTSTTDVWENIAIATNLVMEAVESGAKYVQTPEVTSLMERNTGRLFANILSEEDDPALAAFQSLAAQQNIWLHIGSLPIKLSDSKAANRAFVIDPTGSIQARYDKIHMFDVNLPDGETIRESKNFQPGEQATTVQITDHAATLGLSICYDLRFPHLYRDLAMAGANILSVPAAFTRITGEAHWHSLLRARAIENTCFVIAAGQCGDHQDGRKTFGHSLIVDPWGNILADGGTEPGIVLADIDLKLVTEAREKVPSLQNGRPYGKP